MDQRVLSIQSHVTYGYVGGKAAVFPLQCLGYDVDVINTVNFSNHSGYGRFGGTKTSASELQQILQIMEENQLPDPSRLLTGYIPGPEALSVVQEVAAKLRKRHPKLIYLLDPVMGDSGVLYVSPNVVSIYRAMLPLATIITPNWFEVETLTDFRIVDPQSLRDAIRGLHEEYQVPNVVVSSIPMKPWLAEFLPEEIPKGQPTDLLCIASSKSGSERNSAVYACAVPLIPGYFSGVGDLFSALVLAHFDPDGTSPLPDAVGKALTKTHAIVQLTHAYAQTLEEEDRANTDDELDEKDPMRRVRRMRGRELRLIQGQEIIRGEGSSREMKAWETFW
ncbi:Ribokinase-like protein [Thelephora ganbajun]|uniref:Ribokinase-like protein n=1 Tax=Thelephora ganbajun TaxID=370292 RepID=A0ACB6ZGU9_THEGA|nr:Ribokinase-like protein [Thelephora ganbajun]